MKYASVRQLRRPLFIVGVTLAVMVPASIDAQPGAGAPAARPTARPIAAIDMTGIWVSVISEDWTRRMVTPRKGDYARIPLTPAARRVADTWDPAADEAAGEHCKAYGAPGIIRLPGRFRISWQDDNTMKMELEAGNQTRLFHFSTAPPLSEPSWQGHSVDQWQYPVVPVNRGREGNVQVVTSRLRAGYLLKNGVPYSANTTMTEYFHRMEAPNGDIWLTIVSEIRDPENLREPYVLSTHFKKLPDGAAFNPEPCSAR